MEKTMLVYPFDGRLRILCTAAMLIDAIRAKVNLYITPEQIPYWAQAKAKPEDTFLCEPDAFYTRRGGRTADLLSAGPTDYFLLQDPLEDTHSPICEKAVLCWKNILDKGKI